MIVDWWKSWTSERYERTVEELISRLTDTLPDEYSVSGGSKNRILGASGFQHQIDVSVEQGANLLLFECKRYTDAKVGADDVLTFVARKIDISEKDKLKSVHAVIVSTKPVTKGTEVLASHFDIKINTVSSMKEYFISIMNSNFAGIQAGLRANVSVSAVVRDAQGNEKARF